MGLKNIIVLAFAVGFFVSVIVLVSSLLSSESPYAKIIVNVIELRNLKDDSIGVAKLVSTTDRLVSGTGDELKMYWSRLTECLSAGCDDDIFFDVIVASALEGTDDVPHAKLVMDIVVTNRFWNSEEVVEFSKALAAADEGITGLRSKLLDKQWEAIITCDGTCAEKNNLFFDLIRIVVVQKEE